MPRFLLAILLVLTLSATLDASENTGALHAAWLNASANQDHEAALTSGMKLFHAVQKLPKWPPCHGEDRFEVEFLFDIANTLIQLKRWDEARFCLTCFLIQIQSESEQIRTFGPVFCKKSWLQNNRMEEQPFYLESLP